MSFDLSAALLSIASLEPGALVVSNARRLDLGLAGHRTNSML